MEYISTRGNKNEKKGFREVLLTGLASDGGLFVPTKLPHFTPDQIRKMQDLPYNKLAYNIIHPFIGGEIPDKTLNTLINDSYAEFNHPAIAPLVQLDTNQWLMELFHGPTLAFKDFALQLLGRLLNYVLKEKDERAIVLGATSGDTGSAAIEGCRHSKNLEIFILHPHQRVSEVQRRQMTTILDNNVHNIAIEGNFDDCQDLVKQCFSDQTFLPDNTRLVAVNSINWARIMAQVVYYFYAALRLGAPEREIAFSVPTGNFGDIYAGFIARKMGLPINKLIVATNKNDILHRFFQNNDYSRQTLHHTLSPSMDIMVSSNFERLLFEAYQHDGTIIKELMLEFTNSGKLSVSNHTWLDTKRLFCSNRTSDNEICAITRNLYKKTGYLIDPHTATGIHAVIKAQLPQSIPQVTLATAHPVKFQQAIRQAQLPAPELPTYMSGLLTNKEKYTVIPKDLTNLKNQIKASL